jgi:hypothetical protein
MKINRQESFLIDGLRLMDGLVMIAAGWLMHQVRFSAEFEAQPHPWLIFFGRFWDAVGCNARGPKLVSSGHAWAHVCGHQGLGHSLVIGLGRFGLHTVGGRHFSFVVGQLGLVFLVGGFFGSLALYGVGLSTAESLLVGQALAGGR